MKRENLLKFFIALVVCAAYSSNMSAQVGVRMDVGLPIYNAVNLSTSQVGASLGYEIQGGADYDFRLYEYQYKKHDFTGVLYLTSGLFWNYWSVYDDLKIDNVYGWEHIHENSLCVPIHLKWKDNYRPGRFALYVFAGPDLSLGMSARSSMDMHVSSVLVKGRYNYYTGESEFSLPGYSDDTEDDFNSAMQEAMAEQDIRFRRFEVRFDWGIGFVLKDSHEIVLGFDYSLVNRFKGKHGDSYNMKVSTCYVGYRYRFGK